MDRDTLIERLMNTFLGELEEHVRTLNQSLLALEKDTAGPGRSEAFKTLLRVAHSLKGAARSVGVAPIEESCHRLEEVLAAARDGRRPLDARWFGLLFATADAIEEAGMRLREHLDLTDSPLTQLLPRLESEAASSGAGANEPLPSISFAPSPGPEPETEPESPGVPARPEASPPGEPPTVLSTGPAFWTEPERALGSTFVRVPAEKLDTMLTASGELLVARRAVAMRAGTIDEIRERVARLRADCHRLHLRLGPDASPNVEGSNEAVAVMESQLGRLERDLERFVTTVGVGARQLDRAAARLDDEVRRVRLLPFAEACQGLDRAVRDMARAEGKRVELVIEGGDVELDRSVLEGLRDPLNHLVSNAVDHGIESPADRVAAGKPETGRVTIAAELRGTLVEISVRDDGNGIDLEQIGDEARRRGLIEPSDTTSLADLIFLPGFTTTRKITNISGRGVGLDVVKSRLEALQGTVTLTSQPGRGTTFVLAVPLTLTTLHAVLVEAAGQTFAMASTSIVRLLRVDPTSIRTIEGRPMLACGPRDPGSSTSALVPVAELAALLDLPSAPPAGSPTIAAPHPSRRPALVIVAGLRRIALIVDAVVAEQEVIVKRLGVRVRRAAWWPARPSSPMDGSPRCSIPPAWSGPVCRWPRAPSRARTRAPDYTRTVRPPRHPSRTARPPAHRLPDSRPPRPPRARGR